MKKIKHLFSLVIIPFLMVGCESSFSLTKQKSYLAFQSKLGGKWGLVGLDGEILFENEFDSIPSYANGMFFVQNESGLFDLYSATKEPTLVGSNYTQGGIGVFNERGITAVSRKNKPLEIIDREGNVKFLLDTIDGKKVTSIFPFSNQGITIFKVGELMGCMNEKGDILVTPKYSLLDIYGQNIIGLSYKYIEDYKDEKIENLIWEVLDLNGNTLYEIENVYKLFGTSKVNRFISVSNEIDHNDSSIYKVYNLIDEKGKFVCSTKMLKISSLSYNRDLFCYKDGKAWGVMDIDGNIIIKPKYDRLKFLSDDILCVNNDGEGKTKRLINIKGENVGKNCFFDISKFENGTALAEIEKHKWVLIDERGNIKKELPEIYQVEGWTTRRIYNNDVDIESYVESLKITKYGLDGISFESEWYPITLYAERTNDKMFGDPQITVSLDQGTLQVTEYAKYCNDVIAHFRIIFPSQGFFTEEYEKGPLHPKILYNYTSSVNQMEYNLDKLYDALYRKISQYGYSVKANKNAVVIKGNGICYMVGRTKDVVCIGMGKVTPDIFDISIYDEN